MKWYVWVGIFLLVLTSGCGEKQIIDDLAIETGRAYDLIEDEVVEGTSMIYKFEADKSISNTTFSTTGSANREIVNKLQRKSSDPIAEGSLEVILFSEELAKKGIIDFLDAPQRNPSIGARLFIIVVEDSAKELLEGNYGNRGNATYIANLMKHNIENEDLPKTNLQIFFRDFYQEGKTTYLPRIKKISDDELELTGVSLLKEDSIVDTITAEEMFFFKLLVDRFSEGSHKVKYEDGETVLRSISSRNKMSITSRNPYEILVKIRIKGVTREYTGQEKLTPKMKNQIEKQFSQIIKKECEKLITRFQEKEIDPVGFGFFIKTKTRGFDFKKWKDEYPNLTVKVQANVDIVESGVIE